VFGDENGVGFAALIAQSLLFRKFLVHIAETCP
jgi:hypothetical protein